MSKDKGWNSMLVLTLDTTLIINANLLSLDHLMSRELLDFVNEMYISCKVDM